MHNPAEKLAGTNPEWATFEAANNAYSEAVTAAKAALDMKCKACGGCGYEVVGGSGEEPHTERCNDCDGTGLSAAKAASEVQGG